MTDDFFVYFAHIPVPEMIAPCEGGYTIYISDRYINDRASALKYYQHGVRHAERGDWEKTNVQEIENSAHKEDRSSGHWNGQD